MYSMVLLAAMMTSTNTPSCWGCGLFCPLSCFAHVTTSSWSYYAPWYSFYPYYWGYNYDGYYSPLSYYPYSYFGVPIVKADSATTSTVADLPQDPKEKALTRPDRATIQILGLPEDAKIFIGGQAMKTMGASRLFYSPPLENDAFYHYTVRAEMVHEGEVFTETKEFKACAGSVTKVSFPKLMAAAKNGSTVASSK